MNESVSQTDLHLLETERLILRPFQMEDAKHIFEIRSNEYVMKFMDSSFHGSIEDSEKFVADNIKNQEEGNGFFWAIINKESGEFMGDFSIWNVDQKNNRGQIGYSLKKQYWKLGFMTEAMKEILLYGFKELGLHSYEANINPMNEGSRKCLEKIGFNKEAYFRENYFFEGKYLDSEIYCLIKSDLI